MINIRQITGDDFFLINAWYRERGLGVPPEQLHPPTTYIADVNGDPVLSVSLVLTNCTAVGMIENLITKPNSELSREALPEVIRFIEIKAKEWGVKYLFMNAVVEKLKTKYEEFGFKRKADTFQYLFKEI